AIATFASFANAAIFISRFLPHSAQWFCDRPCALPPADVRLDCSLNDCVGVRFQQVTQSLQAPAVERNLPDVVGVVGEVVCEIDMSTCERAEEANERTVV